MILKTKNIEIDTDIALNSVGFIANFIEDMQSKIDDLIKNYYISDEWTPIYKDEERGVDDLEELGEIETKEENGKLYARFKKYNKAGTLYEPALEDGMVL
jgi:hypothetical protein